MNAWLARLRHDLVKRVAWRARDLVELRGDPGSADTKLDPADVTALRRGVLELRDEQGAQVTATALWRGLRAEMSAEAGDADAGALAAFERVLVAAESAAADPNVAADDLLAAVLRVEPAFEALKKKLSRPR